MLGSFIPVVGALVTGAVAVLLALVANGWVNALIMLGIVLLVQQLESHLLQPFIMGRAVSLHPVAVILAVAAGSGVAGILGALFAVPLLAVANSFIRYICRPRLGERSRTCRTFTGCPGDSRRRRRKCLPKPRVRSASQHGAEQARRIGHAPLAAGQPCQAKICCTIDIP